MANLLIRIFAIGTDSLSICVFTTQKLHVLGNFNTYLFIMQQFALVQYIVDSLMIKVILKVRHRSQVIQGLMRPVVIELPHPV